MSLLRRFLLRLRASAASSRHESRLEEEIETHLELQTAENLRAGMAPEEARRQAVLKFGAVQAIREEYRAERRLPFLEALLQDARYAVRQLRSSPAFTATTLLALGLGIGANTAIFSVIDAVILQPLPFAHPDRLLSIGSLYTRYQPREDQISYPNFFDFRRYNHAFEHFVSYRDSEFDLQTSKAPLHLDGEIVSWDLFPALGVFPVHGRGFLPEEEKPGTNVAVLSYGLWRSQFGGDPGLVGRSVTINGKLFTVVGIAPRNFAFPVENPDVELWTTIAQDASAPPPIDPLTAQRGARTLDAFGRLKPGVSINQTRAQIDAIAAALARQYPDANKNVARTSVKPLLDEVVGLSRVPLLILMGAVGLLLLIACMDVANLLLSRTAERAREFALRAAIGASRAVILRQIFTESLLLGLLGSAAGVLFAFASIPLLIRFAAVAVPRLATARVDVRVLSFAIALALISAVLFSLAPLIQIARIEIVEFIKEGTGGIAGARDRIRRTLVIAQFALGLVLLSGAGLLAATLVKIETRDLGFRPDHLLTFRVDLPDAQYPLAKQIAFDDRLMDQLNAIPGVQSAASGWPLPFEGDQASVSFELMDRPAPPAERPHADIAIVTPGFFHALGIPVVRGRPFTPHDDMHAAPVVIVNQAFAERFFPGQDAIGKRIQSGATNGKGPVIQTIIGIVGNARQSALNRDPDPIYYFPYKQLPWGFGWIVLHTSVPPRNVESAARAAVAAIDPQAPVYKVRTMEDAFSVAIAPARFVAWLLTSFAVIALLLVAVGVYGVMAYSVAKRTREIGVRIAVGADRAAILKMILKEAGVLVCAGIILGLAGSGLTNRVLEHIPYMASLNSSLLLLGSSVTLALAGALAAYLPARRAASVDPVQALRTN